MSRRKPTKAEIIAANRELLAVNEGLRRHVIAQGQALEKLGGALLAAHGPRCGCVYCRLAEIYAVSSRQHRLRGVA